MPRLEIHLLGPPRVLVAGRALAIRRRRALALIALLAASRTPQTRERLATMLWPDADRESGHRQLRNHLWVLRKAGLDSCLSTEGDLVELREGDDLWVDVREHRRLLQSAGLPPGRSQPLPPCAETRLSEAVEIYQDRFLSGFSLPDSLAFEEWQLCEEEALRANQAAALDALTRLREEQGNLEGAVASARRRMELDPLDEGALRSLMNVLVRMGQRSEALLAYERYSRLLMRDMKLAPGPETIRFRNRIACGGQDEIGQRPAPAAPRYALPQTPTPFFGREKELGEIKRCFDTRALRLLTLTGPGGCGKTRLALEAGRTLGDRFPDGVVFVPLASAEAGHRVSSALAEVVLHPLGARERVPSPGDSVSSGPPGELIDFLREKRMLIILDNLEQLASDVAPLREILARTRNPVILATSRSRLHLAAEQVLELEGLPWPRRKASANELSQYASVSLFLQAVRRIRGPFTPSPIEWLAAAEVCRRLRGHPLGIELAASWAHCLSIAEIAGQLAESLDLEAAPRADLPPRHRSLRAVFEQSWRLLSSDERAAFRRLSLSTGSFDREAALKIGGAEGRVFASLVEQSFLRRTRDRRFEILETLRQFGREKLSASTREESAVRDRAARHYLATLTESRMSLEGAGQKDALRHLAYDHHNLRQAYVRAAERGWMAELAQASRPLFLFYDMSGRATEGAEVFGSAVRYLTRSVKAATARAARRRRLVANMRVAQGWFSRYPHPDRFHALMRQGRRDLARVGTPIERAFANALVAIIDPISSSDEQTLREGALQCERDGDLWCAALCWEVLSYHLRTSDPDEGFRVLHRSLALRRRRRDHWSVASGLHSLGMLLEARGLFRAARRRYLESLTLMRRLGTDPDGTLYCLEALTRMALREGAAGDACRYGGEALTLAQRLGNLARIAVSQARLAQAHYLSGNPAAALPLLESALIAMEGTTNAGRLCHLHALSGVVAFEMGEVEEAQWSLEQALSAMPPDADPTPALPAAEILLRAWPMAWRDLLEARLALHRNELAVCRRALVRGLRSALDSRHAPLVWEILAARVESDMQSGHGPAAGRVGSLLLAHSVVSEQKWTRLQNILQGLAKDTPALRAAEVGNPPSTALFALATEVLPEEESQD